MDITGLGSVFDFGSKIIDKIWPNPADAAAAKLKMYEAQQAGAFKELEMDQALRMAQIGVNAVEAASASTFTSGWRPFIGWVCGAALAYKFIAGPLLSYMLAVFGHPVELPVLDFAEMSTILMGLLGLGGLRTIEKIKGVSAS